MGKDLPASPHAAHRALAALPHAIAEGSPCLPPCYTWGFSLPARMLYLRALLLFQSTILGILRLLIIPTSGADHGLMVVSLALLIKIILKVNGFQLPSP